MSPCLPELARELGHLLAIGAFSEIHPSESSWSGRFTLCGAGDYSF